MRKLEPKELTPGMITLETVLTPHGQELCQKGEELTRQLINRMKLYRVEYVFVEGEDPVSDTEEISPSPTPVVETPEPIKEAPKAHPKTHIEETKTHSQKIASSNEFRTFQIEYFEAINELKIIFKEITEEKKPLDSARLLRIVSPLYLGLNTITELFDMLHHMRSIKDTVFCHSLNVALISRMIGRWLHFEKHDLDILTLAGLLHDIGKGMIPNEILEKPSSLTLEEYELIKKHPKFGYDILKNQNLDSRIKKAALMHHERCDGTGYPSGLESDLIDDFAMIVAIADVYDAMTATRAHRSPLCPFQVIATFEDDGYQKYHPKYLLTFLKQIAKTYQSNRVILNDGRACNIIMLNSNSLSQPIVQFDDNTCIDLSAQRELYITALL